MLHQLDGELDHPEMLLHVEGGRFAGGADGNHAVDARGDLLLQEMGDGGFVDAAVAKGSD